MFHSIMTRGERNNNPGNIVKNGIQWRGMATRQNDPRFVVFETPVDGIRALARTLWAYQVVHQLDTVKEIIDRWAPPVENNTSAYVLDVAGRLEIDPDAHINLEDAITLQRLCWAIIIHENGDCIYSNITLSLAVSKAIS